MLAKQELIERRAVVENALASQQMEGLEPDNQAVQDAYKWAMGGLSIATAIENYKAHLWQLQHERV